MIDPSGQRVDASNRLYLAAGIPMLIVWGARDSMIPVEHAHAAHRQVPGSRLEIFEQAGHFPQLSEPHRFAEVLSNFIAETEPAELDPARLRELLVGGASPSQRVRRPKRTAEGHGSQALRRVSSAAAVSCFRAARSASQASARAQGAAASGRACRRGRAR